jgi:hypothetical protein
MMLAKVAIDAMLSWQAKHRGDGSARYCFEPVNDSTEDAYAAWGIFDRKDGLTQPIGVVHDPLLAQQIIDDLNKRNVFKGPLP